MEGMEVVGLLEARIGLDPDAVGVRHLASVIASRMRACGVSDGTAYAGIVQADAEEFQQLVEAVTVTETSFFRDREPFRFLRGEVGAWQGRRGHPLRILCAACATGEEAYSISITCLEAGYAPGRYMVDAIDISRSALRFARAARYPLHSFRGGDTACRDTYFDKDGSVYVPRACVLSGVRFREGNLVCPSTWPETGLYDVVFCRNVMIYLQRPIRQRLLEHLDAHVVDGGLLFVGHAEMTGVRLAGYTPVAERGAFAFRKKGS